jgi:hypothetical protein
VAGELALEDRLARLVLSTGWMPHALETGREVAPPDWLIGAGAIRSLVWDHLHAATAAVPKDIDLVFFDAGALNSAARNFRQRHTGAGRLRHVLARK